MSNNNGIINHSYKTYFTFLRPCSPLFQNTFQCYLDQQSLHLVATVSLQQEHLSRMLYDRKLTPHTTIKLLSCQRRARLMLEVPSMLLWDENAILGFVHRGLWWFVWMIYMMMCYWKHLLFPNDVVLVALQRLILPVFLRCGWVRCNKDLE